MTEFEVEIIKRTFLRVTADSKDDAGEIALNWATRWDQPEGAVIDGEGGLEVVSVIEVK